MPQAPPGGPARGSPRCGCRRSSPALWGAQGRGWRCAACGKSGRQGSQGSARAVQEFGWLTVPARLGGCNAGPAGRAVEELVLCCGKVKAKSHPRALQNVSATWSLRKLKLYTPLNQYRNTHSRACPLRPSRVATFLPCVCSV